MKAVLALAVLSVIAAVSDSSTITRFFNEPSVNEPSIDDLSTKDLSADDLSASDRSARYNLNVGYIGVGDRLLSRVNVVRGAIANAIQYEDRIYRGSANTRITAIQAFENGATQFATAYIINGGLSRNNVTVRFTSARGRGYNYQLSIWGR